jgi:hypothetical protein
VAPAHGLPGTQVALSGSAFTGATLVSFGGAAAVFVVDDDAHITAVVPAAAVTGPVVVVTRGGRTATEPFTVTRTSSLTLHASRALVRARRSVGFSGLLRPSGLGAAITVTVQRRGDGVWKTVRTATRGAAPSGTYSWSFRPSRRGSYRVSASLAASPEATAAHTPWVGFRVR